ncbi:MAG: DUF6323 family protein [Eubacteriales bacterium]|nr:DUF6323 family protein [Eubacteriales bacterium]
MVEDSFNLIIRQTQTAALTEQLHKCNELSTRYGLRLTDTQIASLSRARVDALLESGRVEFGVGALPALIYAFCDSPYIVHEDYCQTLSVLQDLFYQFKNELGTTLSDEELISAMEQIYNGKAQGSLEALENATTGDLYRALTGTPEEEEEDDD